MQLNADFAKRAVVHSETLEWLASPMKGVSRRMLDRIGDEVARATTIVRYDPGSAFSPHIHDGGEEFIVLEGVFQDEHGDYPAGTYIRNPPTTQHTPRSDDGCTILVKLWQFDPEDRTSVKLDINALSPEAVPSRAGVLVAPLFEDDRETVQLETWQAGQSVTLGSAGGAEYFVLDGGFTSGGEEFSKNSWLRLPEKATETVQVSSTGAKVWVKTGHLPFAKAPG